MSKVVVSFHIFPFIYSLQKKNSHHHNEQHHHYYQSYNKKCSPNSFVRGIWLHNLELHEKKGTYKGGTQLEELFK